MGFNQSIMLTSQIRNARLDAAEGRRLKAEWEKTRS